MTIDARPNSKEANYLISLEDADGTKIGFIPTDAAGKENISVVKRFPLVRTGLKTATGSTKYSDFEEPYMSIPQDDWTGGRGSEDLDDDATKFYDSCSVDTSSEVGVILAGLPTYTTGYRSQDFNMPGDVVWKALYDTSQYRSRSFVAGSTYNAVRLELIIRRRAGIQDDQPGRYRSLDLDPSSGGVQQQHAAHFRHDLLRGGGWD